MADDSHDYLAPNLPSDLVADLGRRVPYVLGQPQPNVGEDCWLVAVISLHGSDHAVDVTDSGLFWAVVKDGCRGAQGDVCILVGLYSLPALPMITPYRHQGMNPAPKRRNDDINKKIARLRRAARDGRFGPPTTT